MQGDGLFENAPHGIWPVHDRDRHFRAITGQFFQIGYIEHCQLQPIPIRIPKPFRNIPAGAHHVKEQLYHPVIVRRMQKGLSGSALHLQMLAAKKKIAAIQVAGSFPFRLL